MTLSPAELRHDRPGRGLMGYRRADVDRLLVEATVAYENVWRERAELTDHVHELEQELIRHRHGEVPRAQQELQPHRRGREAEANRARPRRAGGRRDARERHPPGRADRPR